MLSSQNRRQILVGLQKWLDNEVDQMLTFAWPVSVNLTAICRVSTGQRKS